MTSIQQNRSVISPRYFIGLDFDGTAFQTFVPGPNRTDVEHAYAVTILEMFNMTGLQLFEASGLMNRSAYEIVSYIYENADRDQLNASLRKYYEKNEYRLEELVPRGKGVGIGGKDIADEAIATEVLVRGKLRMLLGQIGAEYHDESGAIWPLPTNGFVDFWQAIHEIKSFGNVGLDTAVISSGHETFITKTFDCYQLPLPDILITDNDIRGMQYPMDNRIRTKPGPLPLALAYKEWLKLQGAEGTDKLYAPLEARDRMIFFGDDIHKDGGLAKTAAIPFGLYSKNPQQGMDSYGFSFSNWEDISNTLQDNMYSLRQGVPLREIFLPNIQGEGRQINSEGYVRRGVER